MNKLRAAAGFNLIVVFIWGLIVMPINLAQPTNTQKLEDKLDRHIERSAQVEKDTAIIIEGRLSRLETEISSIKNILSYLGVAMSGLLIQGITQFISWISKRSFVKAIQGD